MIIDPKTLIPVTKFVSGMKVAFVWNGVVKYGTFLNEVQGFDDNDKEITLYKVEYKHSEWVGLLTHNFEDGLYYAEKIKELKN